MRIFISKLFLFCRLQIRQPHAFWGLLFLFAAQAYGYTCPKAQSSFLSGLNLPTLTANFGGTMVPEKVLNVDRIKSSVIFAVAGSSKSSKILATLKDGDYVFLIDRKGQIAIIPRTLDPNVDAAKTGIHQPDKYVGSHFGLRMYLKSIDAKSQTVSTGQFLIRDGAVFAFSNGSGSFRGGEASLKFAIDVLMSLGLRIEESTRVQDYASGLFADPHENAASNARLELEIKADPIQTRMLSEMRRTFAKFYRKGFSGNQFLNDRMKDSRGNPNEAYAVMYLVENWDKGIEPDVWLVQRYFKNYSQEDFYKFLSIIDNYYPGLNAEPNL